MRAAWLVLVAVLVAVLALAGCSDEVAGAPAKDDSPVVTSVDLVVPIELRPVVEQGTPTSAEPPVSDDVFDLLDKITGR